MSENCVICFDFDGVLHNFSRREDDFPTPGGPPVVGARTAVRELLSRGYSLVIFSARANEPGGPEAIEAWLDWWLFPPIPVSLQKPEAKLYVDDRGFRFEGHNSFFSLFDLLNETPIPGRWGRP